MRHLIGNSREESVVKKKRAHYIVVSELELRQRASSFLAFVNAVYFIRGTARAYVVNIHISLTISMTVTGRTRRDAPSNYIWPL